MSLLRLPGWQTVEVIGKPKAYRITATYSDEPSACPQDGHQLYRHGIPSRSSSGICRSTVSAFPSWPFGAGIGAVRAGRPSPSR